MGKAVEIVPLPPLQPTPAGFPAPKLHNCQLLTLCIRVSITCRRDRETSRRRLFGVPLSTESGKSSCLSTFTQRYPHRLSTDVENAVRFPAERAGCKLGMGRPAWELQPCKLPTLWIMPVEKRRCPRHRLVSGASLTAGAAGYSVTRTQLTAMSSASTAARPSAWIKPCRRPRGV